MVTTEQQAVTAATLLNLVELAAGTINYLTGDDLSTEVSDVVVMNSGSLEELITVKLQTALSTVI